MPYTADSKDLPDHVMKMPMAKKKKWVSIWNATHAACVKDGGGDKECEGKAFRYANGVLKKDRDEQDRAMKMVDSWSGASGNYKSAESYCAACLIDVNDAAGKKEKTKSHCALPVKMDGESMMVDEAVMAAAARFNQLKKPEGVSDSAWKSALTAAADKMLAGYKMMDKPAPDSLYEAAGKTPPKKKERSMDWLTRMFNKLIGLNHKERALSLDNLMQKIYKHMYEMEEANKTYYSIARLMVDESGLWVVLNDHGTLYRTNVSVDASGEVMLSEPQEVKEEYTPVKQNRVWLKRQIDGTPRVYVVAATAILNRVNEIDSRKLFDNMVQHAEESDFYPAIDIHHLGPYNSDLFDIGYIDFVARVGVTYIASGVLDETKPLGKRMARTLERDTDGEWGCSIEYFALAFEQINIRLGDNGTIPVDMYTDGVNTRISLLLEQRAANWFTGITLKERGMTKPTKDALLTLRKLFDTEEEFEEFVSQLAEVNDEVEQRGLIHRDADKVEAAKSEQLDPEIKTAPTAKLDPTPVERELVIDDATVGVIADQVLQKLTAIEPTAEEVARAKASDAKLDQILASVNALVKRLDASDGRLEKLERSKESDHQDWVADLPPRLKERIVVTHKPSQANGNQEAPTAETIANNTLSKVPSLGKGI